VTNNNNFDVDNTQKGKDSLTIAMIIKDPEDNSVVYNVTLPQLFSQYKDSLGRYHESNDNTLMQKLMLRGVNEEFYRE